MYTQVEAERSLAQIEGINYETPTEILPGLSLTLYDAGHILGSSIVELTCTEDGKKRVLAFSGDLGYRDAPMMNPPVRLRKGDADLLDWYGAFENRPPVYLVHGEERSQIPLAKKLQAKFDAPVTIARHGQIIDIG